MGVGGALGALRQLEALLALSTVETGVVVPVVHEAGAHKLTKRDDCFREGGWRVTEKERQSELDSC